VEPITSVKFENLKCCIKILLPEIQYKQELVPGEVQFPTAPHFGEYGNLHIKSIKIHLIQVIDSSINCEEFKTLAIHIKGFSLQGNQIIPVQPEPHELTRTPKNTLKRWKLI